MAIQITDRLLREVNDHILSLCKTAITAEFGSPNDAIPFDICGKDAAIMDQLVWGDHLHLRDSIPSAWCKKIDSNAQSSWADKIGVILSEFPDCDGVFKFAFHTENKEYLAPPSFCLYDFEWRLNSDTVTDLTAPIYETLKSRVAVTLRWRETRRKVKEFLKTCRSLNQAVKLWPEVVNFLPPERRQRLEEENKPKTKKERTTPAPEEVLGQINRDAIAGDLVALRFATC